MKVRNQYHKYFKELSKYSDALDSDMATTTHRIGLKRIRDLFTIVRNFYSEGNSYTGMARDFFSIFVLMTLLASQWHIAPYVSILLAITYVSVNMVFGYISYKHLNLVRAENEYSDKMSVSRYMTYDLLKQIIANQELILKKKKRK
jgi:hypothetical protein